MFYSGNNYDRTKTITLNLIRQKPQSNLIKKISSKNPGGGGGAHIPSSQQCIVTLYKDLQKMANNWTKKG